MSAVAQRRRAADPPRRGRRTQARRPGPSLAQRVAPRLPRFPRVLALVLVLGLSASLVYLLAGPMWRVEHVERNETAFAPPAPIAERLARVDGSSVLALDTRALEADLAALPGIASVRAEAVLPNRVAVTIDEHEPALIWDTHRARLIAAEDGAVVTEYPDPQSVPADLAALPVVDDRRAPSSRIGLGDRLAVAEVAAALRLVALDPALLGSQAPALSLRIDPLYGFTVIAPDLGWEAAFGFYGREPEDHPGAAAARMERQITAVRTLFATQPETTVAWLDVRNPGKVYFRATGG